MKLLIVRHADPDYSIDSLTPTGWKEAALLAERLSRLEIAAFYVSPLGRAKDTASLTLKKMGRSATECPWLREFSAPIHKPGAEGESIPWDWLPADWTAEPRFFDRDAWLERQGLKVLRYSNRDVNQNFQGVCEDILLHIHQTPAGKEK